ncbi:MAG: hypothetical protein NC093_03980 [Alistipes sp.]|nr:hypothetical protein [Alistipes sp.]
MKVYPLIYSRTKLVDYVSGFLVRPSDLDYTVAAKYVSNALNEIKYSDGLRHAVFSVGDYIVYGGTACITPALISRILKEKSMNQLDFEYKDFQNDQAGRPIAFFIGFAVKRESIENANHMPNIDLYKTYKIYLKYLQKQWLSTMTKTEALNADDSINIEIIEGIPKFSPESIKKNGISIIKNYEEDLYQDIINYYFRQSVMYPNIDSSFLSCILPEMINDGLIFKNISLFGISAEEYLMCSENKKEKGETIQSSKTDETPKIFHSADEFKSGISSNTSVQQRKRPNTDLPPVYHSVHQYEQEHGDDNRKKASPTSRKLLAIIAIALLVGMLLFVAHSISNPKKKLNPRVQEVQVSSLTDNTIAKTPQQV